MMTKDANSAPLVSVIVPVYNVEKYLERCLDSIIEQTYRNLEIILVNDGSTDGSGEICCQYAKSDSRICVFTQENQGLSAARNTGLDHMTGSYIIFVDSDDYISPCMVEILLKQVLTQGVSIAVCNYLEAKDDDNYAQFDVVAINGICACEKMEKNDVFDTMGTERQSRFLVAWGKLYDKRIFDELRFPVNRIYEDTYVFCPIYVKADAIGYVDLKLYAYRMSENSIIRSNGKPTYDWELLMEAYLERLKQFKFYGFKKYVGVLEKLLFRDLISLSSYMERREYRAFAERIERERYHITGRKSFPPEYILFKLSPKAYRFIRENYLKAKHLAGFLRH